LGALVAAASLLDLIWPFFLLVGWEEVEIQPGNTKFTPLNFISYPISHGLVAVIGWATLFAVCYQMIAHYKPGTIAIWLLVVSHWLLDAIVHIRDLPLYAGGPKYGLGLWNHPRATIAVEALIFAFGVLLYETSTRAKDAVGRWAFWAFLVTLGALYVANVLEPPPPTVKKMAIVAAGGGLLLVLWSWWFDRHREPNG
jgi:hypothetical protein